MLAATEVMGCAVAHANETRVALLAPGTGKTQRAYLWAETAGAFEALCAVVNYCADSRW